MENREYIKKISLFRELEDEDIDKISEILVEKKYKKDMIIFMEQDPAEAVCLIKKGKVKIFKTTNDGKEHIIHIMKDGDIFAEACLFIGGTYPASSQVIEDSDVFIIKNKDMEKLLETNPQIAVKLVTVMAKRLTMVSNQIENLALRDAYGKTASLLIQLLKNSNEMLRDGVVIKIALSRQDMGNMVGLSRETFTRALSRLKQEGVIDINKDEIVITSVKKLKEWIY